MVPTLVTCKPLHLCKILKTKNEATVKNTNRVPRTFKDTQGLAMEEMKCSERWLVFESKATKMVH